jgi:nucleoside-diphosphate-sugar epimerase
MKENSLAAMERSCVIGSSKLFDAAAAAGVKKPIFISSISAFTGARSAYGRSKLMVEDMVLRRQGVILRLGMVYGKGDGGAFGSLKKVVRKARIVPLIGDGSLPQYLLHEATLTSVIRRAVRGDFNGARRPLSLAQPEPVALRTLLRYIAATQNKRIWLVPVPWVLLYLMLKSAEFIGLDLNFRSDSLISYIFQDPAPDFGALEQYGIEPVLLSTHGAD